MFEFNLEEHVKTLTREELEKGYIDMRIKVSAAYEECSLRKLEPEETLNCRSGGYDNTLFLRADNVKEVLRQLLKDLEDQPHE
jgi:hypothetical protein